MHLDIRLAFFALAALVSVPAVADEPQPQPAGSGTCHGTVAGRSPEVHDAMFVTDEESGFQIVTVMLNSFVGGCPDHSPAPPRVDDYERGTIIGFELIARNGAPEGTYIVHGPLPQSANAELALIHGLGAEAIGGIVQVTYRGDDVVEGNYDLAFEGGERLKGVFSAGSCPGLRGGTPLL